MAKIREDKGKQAREERRCTYDFSVGGLNGYHYGARFYDVEIARWTSLDPADEFHTPYTYVGGDPVNLVDPDGRQAVIANASWFSNYFEPITQDGRQVGNVEVIGTRWFDEEKVENRLNSLPAKWKKSSPRVTYSLNDLKQRLRSEWIPVLIADRMTMADGRRATGARNRQKRRDCPGSAEVYGCDVPPRGPPSRILRE